MKTFALKCMLITLICSSMTQIAKSESIVETAVKAKKFSTLIAAAKAAGLVETLQGKKSLTVFAPTDEAFDKLPKGTLESLLKPENKQRLAEILTYHVLPGKIKAEQAIALDNATTVLGQRIKIESDLGRLTINESKVIQPNIECDNGIIHVIDSVLIPTDKTIPGIADQAGTFKTLLAAVTTAELAQTLGSEGPFTVFAPSDDAFSKLPVGTVENLLKPEQRKTLVSILTYHVIPGRVYADEAIAAGSAKTLNGQPISIQLTAEGIQINNSTVTAADIQASNGVIHVIDNVLMPETLDVARAQMILENAVSVGSQAFNHGDYHRCSEVYQEVCTQIVDDASELPEEVSAVLQIALKRVKQLKSEREQSWTLRHGIDLAYFALEQKGMER